MQTHHLPFGSILIYLIIQIIYNKLIIIAEFRTNGVQLPQGGSTVRTEGKRPVMTSEKICAFQKLNTSNEISYFSQSIEWSHIKLNFVCKKTWI